MVHNEDDKLQWPKKELILTIREMANMLKSLLDTYRWAFKDSSRNDLARAFKNRIKGYCKSEPELVKGSLRYLGKKQKKLLDSIIKNN